MGVLVRSFGHLDNRWDLLWAAFFDSHDVFRWMCTSGLNPKTCLNPRSVSKGLRLLTWVKMLVVMGNVLVLLLNITICNKQIMCIVLKGHSVWSVVCSKVVLFIFRKGFLEIFFYKYLYFWCSLPELVSDLPISNFFINTKN